VATQNLTLKLPADTIRKAKIVAAERGTSISALVTQKIEEVVGEDAAYQTARRRAFEWLSHGWHLGGPSTALGASERRDG
jgi:diphthamide biosynthesis methyltransferase